MTMAASAHDWRSPVDRSMSISRGSGVSETSSAIRISSSVVCPRADRTATTPAPASFLATMRPAARLMRSASATDVPPNFMTTVPFKARKIRACAAAVLAAGALASCGGGGGDQPAVARGPLPPAGVPSLGLPLEAAVAQLFAVGFPGTGPQAPIVAKLRERDWGAVVLGPANA